MLPLSTTESKDLERTYQGDTKMMEGEMHVVSRKDGNAGFVQLEEKANEGSSFSPQLQKRGYGDNEGEFLVEVYSEREDAVVTSCSKGNWS